MNEILSLREIVPNVHEIVLDAPDVAVKAQPGQFGIIIPDETGERIPLSLAGWDREEGTVSIYFLEVGVSTMKLAKRKEGDYVDFVAPLGKPATVEKFGTVFIGGGCYGIGAINPIVKAMKETGNKVITSIEARSEYLLYNEEELRNYSDEFILTTSDASIGTRGKVKSALEEVVENGEKIDMAYFMGCTFMMMVSAERANELGIKSFVYLNPLMVDATGMCGVCRVSVGGETKFACVDGPEFPGEEVNWEELSQRKSQYKPQEKEAYQYQETSQHKCKLESKKEGGE